MLPRIRPVVAAAFIVSQSLPAVGIEVEVQVEKEILSEGEPVRLRVTLDNGSDDCSWVAIDPFVVPDNCGNRPFTILQPEVTDVAGRAVVLIPPPLGLAPAFEPGDLLILDCGEFFGATVEISTAPAAWKARLPPGRYSARVIAVLRVGDFFDAHPELMRAEATRRFKSEDSLRSMLVNQVFRSEPVTFTVADR